MAILGFCIQSNWLQSKIMKHTSKQLKRIWSKLVLNIRLNKRKLSKQQIAVAIYMTFYSYHYTDIWWARDIKADSVRVGIQGAVFGLHGADAQQLT